MKKNFPIIKRPMLMLFLVSAFVLALENMSNFSFPLGLLGYLIELCVSQLLAQVFAYLTFLLLKNKDHHAAWTNYVIWALLLNLGRFAQLINP